MPARESMTEELAFLQDLWALDHAMQALSRRMLERYGVTGPQRLLVRVVGRLKGCTPGQAARQLHLHPATVSRLAARLASAGFLERRADPDDGRQVRLVLTRRGKSIDALLPGTVETAVRQVLEASPPGRGEETRAVLAQLTKRLSGAPPPAGRRRAPPRPGVRRRAIHVVNEETP